MKKTLFTLFLCATFSLLFTSCATIVGGAKYNARIRVPDHPNAKISINGQYRGNGEATMLVNRKEANMLNVTVQEGDDEPQTTLFTGRKFRGWPFVGSLLWNFPILGTGIIIDACTGAWWKPDVNEQGVTKVDVDNYLYTITYRPTTTKPSSSNSPLSLPNPQKPISDTIVEPTITPPSVTPIQPLTRTKAEALRELKQLFDEGVLTQEEYDKEKAKLLEAN